METPPRGLLRHDEGATGIKFSDHVAGAAPFNWSSIVPKNVPAPGKNQGGSSSCTAQATAYGIFSVLGIDISREDIYANTKLPGGGSYLVSPFQWLESNGYLTLVQHPDPNPETEANMSEPTGASNAQRTPIALTMQVFNSPTIDQVAQAIYANDIVCIGIDWTAAGFAGSWTEPGFSTSYPAPDGHDLWCMNPIKTGSALNAIDCESSWYGVGGPDGISTHHEIDQNFFANGGVFELITVNVTKKGKPMQLVQTPDKTVYMLAGTPPICTGIADAATLTTIFGDEPITQVPSLPSGVVEKFTLGQGFVVNKK